MARRLFRILLVLLATALLPPPASAQEPFRIYIHSSEFSFAVHETTIIVTKKGKRYLANGKVIRAELVQALLAAIEAPDEPELRLENLGINDEWLSMNAESEFEELWSLSPTPEMRELFMRSFRDPAVVRKALDRHFGSYWTDDYPVVRVAVSVGDRSIVLDSRRQQLFMIPWTISRDEVETTSYNVNIAKAIAAFLPKGAPNKDRLSGTDLPSVVREGVLNQIKAEWEHLASKAQADESLKTPR